jgi:hypothetical protein
MPDSRPFGKPEPERIKEDTGDDRAEALRELRADLGLDQPYGPQAVALKIGPARPIPLPDAEKEPDPTEPEEPVLLEVELLDVQEQMDERLPGDAAEVPLDDLPF